MQVFFLVSQTLIVGVLWPLGYCPSCLDINSREIFFFSPVCADYAPATEPFALVAPHVFYGSRLH